MENETMHCRVFRDSEKNMLALQEILDLGRYNPWYEGHNPNFDEFSRLILDVKDQRLKAINYFTDQLRSILSDTEEYVICVIPTHAVGTAPSGIRTIAKQLCLSPLIDGIDVLSRVFEIPKKAISGSRNLQLEIKSLTVRNENIIKGRQVLLMDDVTTTGTSLQAGKYLLERAGVALIALLALAKTQRERSS
jgi:predicted amidophosphoribosyltransferase